MFKEQCMYGTKVKLSLELKGYSLVEDPCRCDAHHVKEA
jgi:hypothetical protein